MNKNKVNLFVVGAMKAGTTSLTDLLSQHSDIYVPPIKEPHFFIDNLPNNLYEPSRFFDLENYLKDEFPKPLHITKIENESQYNKVYSLADQEKYLVDSSTAYLHAPNAHQKIYNYNPFAKIIILLRDPLQRAFSHYRMNVGLGREKRTFETALREEIKLYTINLLPWNSYLGMSFYEKAIKNYESNFKEVLVLRIEQLQSECDSEWRRLEKFLKISELESLELEHKNKTRKLRIPKLFYLLKYIGLKDYFSIVFNSKFKRFVFNSVSSNNRQKMNLSSEIRKELEAIFNIESTR